ncbi:MAG: c-type cytochrome, partial [Albidovulum sp.]
EDIVLTVRHGIRNETDAEARYSQMPAFKDLIEAPEIDAVVEYVVSLSSTEFDAALAETGALVFADNCAACHGDTAIGDREQGAPDLTDAIWLYGGDRDALTATVSDSRFGIMPAWGQRLSEADVRAVSAYVHSLGGGE